MELAHGLKEGSNTVMVPMTIDASGRLLVRIDAEPAYASIVDSTTSTTYTYMCEAMPGTLEAAAAWRICRMNNATGVTTWADGNANFDNVAANRAALNYS